MPLPPKMLAMLPFVGSKAITEESRVDLSDDDLEEFSIVDLEDRDTEEENLFGSFVNIPSPEDEEFEVLGTNSLATGQGLSREGIVTCEEELSFSAQPVGNSFVSHKSHNSSTNRRFAKKQQMEFHDAEKNERFFTRMELNDQNQWTIITNRPEQEDDELVVLKDGEDISVENEMKILFGKARPVLLAREESGEDASNRHIKTSSFKATKSATNGTAKTNTMTAGESFWFFTKILDCLTSILSFIVSFLLLFRLN